MSIEQVLATEKGQYFIGTIMATDNLYDAVLQQLNLLDVPDAIIQNIVQVYQLKLQDMQNNDSGPALLLSDSDPEIKKLLMSIIEPILANEPDMAPSLLI